VRHVYLPLVTLSQQDVDCFASIREVAVADAEIGEEAVFLGLQPELRVAEDDVIIVIGDSLMVLFSQVEDALVSKGNKQCVLGGCHFGDERTF
jgi:hypothetical protein